MKFLGYLRVASFTTLNIVLNAATLGHYVWLEGSVRRDVFTNWAKRFRYAPTRFARPTTQDEIAELVRNSRSVRVFGSAHSFNEGIVSDEALVSLDDCSGLVWKDRHARRMAVKGGTRVRDVVKLMLDEGLAFRALPSHDAQSIAGILSTDVHGTGNALGSAEEWGFVSQSVVGLKLIDGKGEAHECGPDDDLFKAAIGGVGAVGIISEVWWRASSASTSSRWSGPWTPPSSRITSTAPAGERPPEPLPLPLHAQVPGQHLEPHGQKAFGPRRPQGVS
jgi:FAD/FMN-containing dehydrogenase